MDQRAQIVTLAERMAGHLGVTHFAISMRAFGKGDFFKRLMDGRDCQTKTALRALGWFSENWPKDLPWPAEIERPKTLARKVVR